MDHNVGSSNDENSDVRPLKKAKMSEEKLLDEKIMASPTRETLSSYSELIDKQVREEKLPLDDEHNNKKIKFQPQITKEAKFQPNFLSGLDREGGLGERSQMGAEDVRMRCGCVASPLTGVSLRAWFCTVPDMVPFLKIFFHPQANKFSF
ncbi:hypothetical protein BDA96_01G564300 [Sorghum bicolor]|uniref:Uncharacterized protein n=1 Tax=Sorghum bicolor TaxID=4558 RepID=A0A921S6R4_SORBI|nr:hypothetical protein BDA96_01G564300 [Sorghum bicolor]